MIREKNNKKRILVISDSPLAPSGVGTQTKYMIESMLRDHPGEYQFICLAGAIKHKDYRAQKVSPWEEDWIVHPIDNYGNPEIVRSMLSRYKPDALWFMTDPRFYIWLWEIEDEIRKNVPMIYYHVWDNLPYPTFNKDYYDSTDVVVSISKVTEDIVKNVATTTKSVRIPHAVDTEIFKNHPESERKNLIEMLDSEEKMIFFWNNRNARRKQSGTLIFWFKEFLDEIGHDKATLLMHTEPTDHNGQDLIAITENLNLVEGQVLFSTNKMTPLELAKVYSTADCTINISDAEGFGLSTLESLACETPIIVTLTGGLQEQISNGNLSNGIGIKPIAKSIIGSQDVPWIFEDRISKEQFLSAMRQFYNMTKKEREELGKNGRNHVLETYSLSDYSDSWHKLFQETFEELGSWESRKNYNKWELIKIS
jgi:glycosyltransferase involved in cell wall biosynthesis